MRRALLGQLRLLQALLVRGPARAIGVSGRVVDVPGAHRRDMARTPDADGSERSQHFAIARKPCLRIGRKRSSSTEDSMASSLLCSSRCFACTCCAIEHC